MMAISTSSTGRWGKIVRLFIERGFASRVVRSRVYGLMRNQLGLAAPMLTEDRRVLEQIIFAHFCREPRIKAVLFVGCDSYTAHYQRRYFANHNYWTIDPNANCRRFGSKQHIVARLEELGGYFSKEFFDHLQWSIRLGFEHRPRLRSRNIAVPFLPGARWAHDRRVERCSGARPCATVRSAQPFSFFAMLVSRPRYVAVPYKYTQPAHF